MYNLSSDAHQDSLPGCVRWMVLTEIPDEQLRCVLEGVAREILVEAEVREPPVDCLLLADRLGLVVARDQPVANGALQPRARFVKLARGVAPAAETIFLAEEPRRERRHWAVAHEIGESRAFRVFAEFDVDPSEAPPAAREAVANALAGALLLPREWFVRDGARVDWDLFELKAMYATASHELIARRMLEAPPAIIVTLADQGRCVWRRSSSSHRPPPLTPPERDAWTTAHQQGRPVQCERAELPEGIVDVRAWPIHEEGWKREIIRTELAQW
ncbi:ImmA/IrrE family metallo-endopeptidase [Lacipirellula sp.]|uniref:ImmA/IrrE family metallo-endopeptidase n=1 Tax=Lacipirellula sp. TaxID=2691419 RepID=UPI003D0DE137